MPDMNAPPAHEPAVRALRILLAEDNPLNQQVIRNFLDNIDCHLDIVGNGIDALYAVADATYDLIVMQVNLPLMDGITAAEQIRTMPGAAGSTPIVALASDSGSTLRELCNAVGFDDFIQNPIDQQKLLETIRRFFSLAAPGMSAESLAAIRA